MHAANTGTELHITCVDVLTAKAAANVELPTFCISEWLRAFNFVMPFYFLVLFEQRKETVPLNAALNSVSLQPKYLQIRLKLLDNVCKSGVQVLFAYFVWFWRLFKVYITPKL